MTKSMKAIVINDYGDRNELTETEMPIPKINENQLLVKVVSIGVNPIDWKPGKVCEKNAIRSNSQSFRSRNGRGGLTSW